MKCAAFTLCLMLALPSYAADPKDMLAEMVKGQWLTITMIPARDGSPAMQVDIDERTINRDNYPDVLFSARWVLTGQEKKAGLSGSDGRYNLKIFKIGLDCEDEQLVTHQTIDWFVDYDTKTVKFVGARWGKSGAHAVDSDSPYRVAWKFLCHP